LGGGGNDAVKNTNINEIHILSAGYQKPAKTVKSIIKWADYEQNFALYVNQKKYLILFRLAYQSIRKTMQNCLRIKQAMKDYEN
jgi:hypothetical protein